MRILFVGTLCVLLLGSDARRVRVRPARPLPSEADQEDDQQQQVVYVEQPQASAGDSYNGLYGQAVERADDRYERPTARTIAAQPARNARVKDTPREPPVETIRNYSDINDDGSFTFGYESADGSFKEETRGTDCVVRGKYGYVDPDGNKREFTYVSGNPCDPNAPQEEEEKEAAEDSGEENVPQTIPGRLLRPLRPQSRPQTTRQPTSVFQNNYNQANEEDEEQRQVYLQPAPLRPRPVVRTQAQPIIRVTPRPAIPSSTLPATTYRPNLLVSVTPRPNVVLSKHTTAGNTIGSINFDEELKRFQLNNGVSNTTPRPVAQGTPSTTLRAATPTGQPLYTSELVFDPSSGQYNTVVYQQLPKTTGEQNLKTRLPQYNPTITTSYASPTPSYVTPTPPTHAQPQSSSSLQQQLFNQKNQALFQQSQDLYSQQRLQQLQTQQHRFQNPGLSPAGTRPLSTAPQKFSGLGSQQQLSLPQRPLSLPQYQPETSRPAQQFYYFAPQQDVQQGGQIDAFLRNHNLQF